MQNHTESEIYFGSRDKDFVETILSFLARGKLRQEYIRLLTDDESMKVWSMVLTAKSADPVNNYELYETLGDGVANNALVYYLVRRFPQINCPDGVPVLARLKINLVSKDTYRQLNSEHLGFWPFISASVEMRNTKMKQLLEDTFEAAMGALVLLVDAKIRQGAGAAIAYNIIESLFDRMEISLAFEDLVDAKTRLKETVDAFKSVGPVVNGRPMPPLGEVVYRNQRNAMTKMHSVSAVRLESRNGRPLETVLGTGSAHILKDAEQHAAKMALDRLKAMGYYNAPKESYTRFCRY